MTTLGRHRARLRGLVATVDRFQQRHRFLAFPVAVVRKMSNDQGGSLAALIAHYGFLSLFPLILVFSSVLGFVFSSDPSLKTQAIQTVASSFPSLSGFVGTHTKGSGLALGAGAFVALWAGLRVTRATERAMNNLWDVPLSERPNLWWSRLRGLLMLGILGIAFLLSTGLAGLQQTGGMLAVPVAIFGVVAPLALNFGLYLLAFRVLTNRRLDWRTVVPGAAVGAVGWTALQSLGALYIRHEVAHASELYGTLASVIGLLAWLYLGAILTLYAAEINVVLAHRLWPRSLSGAAETDADRRALVMMAREYERVAGEVISVSFHDGETSDDSTDRAERTERTERAERELSVAARSVHHDVRRLVGHLHAFDRYRQDLEDSDGPSDSQRLRDQMRTEATAMAHDLAHLAAEESVLADALTGLLS
ncbi:MAG: YihY/virulence factor BrkB family protein [Acidimicrobiales bacterium]